jgi:hypothetical protein
MKRRSTKLWLCVLGTVIGFVVAYTISIQNDDQEVIITDLPIGAGMGPDLMTRNGEQNFRQLQQLIDDTIDTEQWQLTGSSPTRPYRTIVSVLINGEGCKTFTYDGDGNLVPEVKGDYDSTEVTDNPFDDSVR